MCLSRTGLFYFNVDDKDQVKPAFLLTLTGSALKSRLDMNNSFGNVYCKKKKKKWEQLS